MCMITVIPANIPLPYEGMINGSVLNDDGHGWAVASPDGLRVGKSMKFDEALDGLEKARHDEGIGSTAMFHSRFATHGTKGEFNVHPFHATESTVVAHNGILPTRWLPSKKDKRSDTRVLVDETIPHYLSPTGIPSRRRGRELGRLIGTGNKLAILSVVERVPRVRIINAHLGTHHGGVWYSNDGFEPWNRGYSTSAWNDDWASDAKVFVEGQEIGRRLGLRDVEDCDICGSYYTVNLDTGICETCETCTVCYQEEAHCECYWNQRLRREQEQEEFWAEQKRIEEAWHADNRRQWAGADTLNPQFIGAADGTIERIK